MLEVKVRVNNYTEATRTNQDSQADTEHTPEV